MNEWFRGCGSRVCCVWMMTDDQIPRNNRPRTPRMNRARTPRPIRPRIPLKTPRNSRLFESGGRRGRRSRNGTHRGGSTAITPIHTMDRINTLDMTITDRVERNRPTATVTANRIAGGNRKRRKRKRAKRIRIKRIERETVITVLSLLI